jgi:hypothetical protein
VDFDVTDPFLGISSNANMIVEIVKLFAKGGFGNVYRGWDYWCHEEVAIKETNTGSEPALNGYHESRILQWINAKDPNSE